MSLFIQQNCSISNFNTSDSWVILSQIEQSIKRKIEAIGKPLKDWDIQIYRGVLTGYNEAFIISTEKRDEILSNCLDEDERKRTAEIIRPILRGRDIKRYGYNWADLWLLWIPWHFPLHLDKSIEGVSTKAEHLLKIMYPAVYQHLLQHKEELSARNKAETGIRYEWYAMQRWGANYWEDFNKPKIIFQEIVQESSFALDNDIHYYCNDTGRIIIGPHLEHIIGILNSKLFFFAVKHFYGGGILGEHGVRMKHTFFENFPCLRYDMEVANMATQLQQQYTDELSKLLDNLLYDKYGLNDDEREYIEIAGF